MAFISINAPFLKNLFFKPIEVRNDLEFNLTIVRLSYISFRIIKNGADWIILEKDGKIILDGVASGFLSNRSNQNDLVPYLGLKKPTFISEGGAEYYVRNFVKPDNIFKTSYEILKTQNGEKKRIGILSHPPYFILTGFFLKGEIFDKDEAWAVLFSSATVWLYLRAERYAPG